MESIFSNSLLMTIAILLTLILITFAIFQRRYYNKLIFMIKAYRRGVAAKYRETLEHLIVQYKIKDPYSLLDNNANLNVVLKRALKDIKNDPNLDGIAKASLRFNYYKIKHIIESRTPLKREIKTTADLPVRGKLYITLIDNHDLSFNCEIRGQKNGHFILSLPKIKPTDRYAAIKKTINWQRGIQFEALYLGRNNEEYFFYSKVIGVATNTSQPALLCAYTNEIEQTRRRRHLRKSIEITATIAPVFTAASGHSIGQEAPCLIFNISLGGCAIKSNKQENPGNLVCIQFSLHEEKVTCYGKVLRTERKGQHLLVRIQFTRATKASLNAISHLIYEL